MRMVDVAAVPRNPALGLVRLTVGGASTTSVIGAEVCLPPWSSVATAVIV
ncbi:MAG: hypothetical protein U0235_02790 [Polyangiaceae bacterium]